LEGRPDGEEIYTSQTSSGVYHKVQISAEFNGDRLSSFQVVDYSELDFSIENIYDKDI